MTAVCKINLLITDANYFNIFKFYEFGVERNYDLKFISSLEILNVTLEIFAEVHYYFGFVYRIFILMCGKMQFFIHIY